MTALLIVVAIGLLGFNIQSAFALRSIKKQAVKVEPLNDQKYWELKYSIQSLVTIFGVIAAIAGYLGIKSLEDVKKSISSEVKPQIDSLSARLTPMRDSVRSIDTTLRRYTGVLNDLQANSAGLKSSLTVSTADLLRLKGNLAEINKKNKIQAPVYVVNDIEVNNDFTDGKVPKSTQYFTSLTTSTGDKLPVFDKPPTIIVAANNGTFSVTNVTTTSFVIGPTQYLSLETGPTPKLVKVTVIIIQNP